MSDKLTAMRAVESISRGGVVFSTEVEPNAICVLDGFVQNSEIVRCSHGEFTWYFAWAQKPSESEADKANQMAKAIQGRPAHRQERCGRYFTAGDQ